MKSNRCYRVFDGLRAVLIVGTLSVIILLAVVQIILRYFTSAELKPFPWGDEVIRLSSIWVSFLAASLGVRSASHLSVDYFVQKYVPPRALRAVRFAATVFVLLVLAVLVWYGVSRTVANIPTSMQNLPISMAWFYAAIPVGSLFLFIEYFLILRHGAHPYGAAAAQQPEAGPAGGAGQATKEGEG